MSCSQTTQVELSLVKTLLDANNNGDCSLSRQLFRFDSRQVDTKIGVEKRVPIWGEVHQGGEGPHWSVSSSRKIEVIAKWSATCSVIQTLYARKYLSDVLSVVLSSSRCSYGNVEANMFLFLSNNNFAPRENKMVQIVEIIAEESLGKNYTLFFFYCGETHRVEEGFRDFEHISDNV